MVSKSSSFSTRNIQIYFQSQRIGWETHLTKQLVDFIAATEQTLDCAIYDLRHPDVATALADLVNNGKQVRIAYDAGKQVSGNAFGDPKPSGNETTLQNAGLMDFATSVHEGTHLMHNKFLVRDGRYVWTGSANFTPGGLELQDNNCLIFDSPELATRYEVVFEDLISPTHSHKLLAKQPKVLPAIAALQVGKTLITPFFSPAEGEDIEQAVVNALVGAQKVRVIAFLISDPGIMEAMSAYGLNPNFDIKGVYDPQGMKDVTRNKKNTSDFWFLNDPRFVAAPSHPFNPHGEQNFMHNKVLIIDDHTVITGSYNFSENAESNDENLLQIGSVEIAVAYTRYFDALFAAYSKHHATTTHNTGSNAGAGSGLSQDLGGKPVSTPGSKARKGSKGTNSSTTHKTTKTKTPKTSPSSPRKGKPRPTA